MIMIPDWINDDLFAATRDRAAARGTLERLGDVRLETLSEGQSVQALHVGSFDDEAELLRRMHEEYIPSHGLTMTGNHHEIYLSDPRKTVTSKLRTILRQPVTSAT